MVNLSRLNLSAHIDKAEYLLGVTAGGRSVVSIFEDPEPSKKGSFFVLILFFRTVQVLSNER